MPLLPAEDAYLFIENEWGFQRKLDKCKNDFESSIICIDWSIPMHFIQKQWSISSYVITGACVGCRRIIEELSIVSYKQRLKQILPLKAEELWH